MNVTKYIQSLEDLIDELKVLPPDTKVMYNCGYGFQFVRHVTYSTFTKKPGGNFSRVSLASELNNNSVVFKGITLH